MFNYDLFSNEFLKRDQAVLYTELLIYILTNANHASPKICVCKHIIQVQVANQIIILGSNQKSTQ